METLFKIKWPSFFIIAFLLYLVIQICNKKGLKIVSKLLPAIGCNSGEIVVLC